MIFIGALVPASGVGIFMVVLRHVLLDEFRKRLAVLIFDEFGGF